AADAAGPASCRPDRRAAGRGWRRRRLRRAGGIADSPIAQCGMIWLESAQLSLSKRFLPVMARITVEDCLKVVDNRFELVLMASKRARQLANGLEATVEAENDKPTVLALREIAERRINMQMVDEIDRAERERA